MIGKKLMKHHYLKKFYGNLNMEDTSDADYKHANIVWKDFEIKNLDEDHDSHVQSDTLLLADIFETFEISALKYKNSTTGLV